MDFSAGCCPMLMIQALQISELVNLLDFAGINSKGTKKELLGRCLQLVSRKSSKIDSKVRELIANSLSSSKSSRSPEVSLKSSFQQKKSLASTTSGFLNVMQDFSRRRNRGASDLHFGIENGTFPSFPSRNMNMSNKKKDQLENWAALQLITDLLNPPSSKPDELWISPEISMRKLPFYETHSTLVRPTKLSSLVEFPFTDAKLSFTVTPKQVFKVFSSEMQSFQRLKSQTPPLFNSVQVHIRFSSFNYNYTVEQEHDDIFPPNLEVRVNNILVPLDATTPNGSPKPEPLNITKYLKDGSDTKIIIQWGGEEEEEEKNNNDDYVVSVYLVRKLTANDLLDKLLTKAPLPCEFTRNLVKKMNSATAREDDICAPTLILVSVACPIVKCRMKYPCRSEACKHLQCFDAYNFLRINENRHKFNCPVCNSHLKFNDLKIDSFFLTILGSVPLHSGNEINVYPDGRWEQVVTQNAGNLVQIEDNDLKKIKRRKVDENCSFFGSFATNLSHEDEDDDVIFLHEEERNSKASSPSSDFFSKNSNKYCERPMEPCEEIMSPKEVIEILDDDENVSR